MSSASADAPPPREGGAPNPTPTSRGGRGEGNRGRGSGRGRGSNRGRGRGDGARGRGRGRGNPANPSDEAAQSTPATQASRVLDFKSRAEPQQGDEDGEVEVCFICANPVSHLAIAPCNHITCHICALRLRALYKSKDCPHCRVGRPFPEKASSQLTSFCRPPPPSLSSPTMQQNDLNRILTLTQQVPTTISAFDT